MKLVQKFFSSFAKFVQIGSNKFFETYSIT